VSAVRDRAVQAFHDASTAADTSGDRSLGRRLHQIALDLGHRDTTEQTLTALLDAFATTTQETHTNGR
jgi:hypothetical protein